MNETCPLCGGLQRFVLAAPDRRFGGAGLHEVWRCEHCGLGQTYPPLSPAALAAAYPANYRPFHEASRRAAGWRKRAGQLAVAGFGYGRAGIVARGLARVRGWEWQPPPPPPGRLLDVGCGSGAYGASLLRLGWRVDGIEPDAIAAERARAAGLQVQQMDVMTSVLAPAAYDVITLWHSLEHFGDPMAALRHLRPALHPGGLLMLEVPNSAGLIARATGSYWFQLDLPRHRWHFTPRSLRMALAQSGFERVRVQHIPNPHGLAGAMAYVWGWRWRWSKLALGMGWAAGMVSAWVGAGDVIRATALGGGHDGV